MMEKSTSEEVPSCHKVDTSKKAPGFASNQDKDLPALTCESCCCARVFLTGPQISMSLQSNVPEYPEWIPRKPSDYLYQLLRPPLVG